MRHIFCYNRHIHYNPFFLYWTIPNHGQKKDSSPKLKDNSDVNSEAWMCATMDELRRQNHNLADNVLNIQQRQQETNPL